MLCSFAQTNYKQLPNFYIRTSSNLTKDFCKWIISLKPFSYAQGQSQRCLTKVTTQRTLKSHANSSLVRSS